MTDTIEVIQKSSPASSTTQVAIQYVGMTPEQASKQTIDLFMENFPKLQKLAQECVEERVKEFSKKLIEDLDRKKVTNFVAFKDPDVQYIIYEAQKKYARFGDKNNLNILTGLISERVKNNDKEHFDKIIDNAIIAAGDLSSAQLDCLSVLFLLTRVRFSDIKTIEDLQKILSQIYDVFEVKKLNYSIEISFLNFKGCLQISLPNFAKILSKTYDLDEYNIKKIMPVEINNFETDYGLSEIGMAIGIINAQIKSAWKFDIHTWIRE